MNCIVKVSFSFILILSATKTKAQFAANGYEVGIHAGTLIYQGDLSEGAIGNYRLIKPAIGIFVGKSFDNYFSARVNLTRGKILADESLISDPEWRQQRGFSFQSSVTELLATLHYHLLGRTSATNYSRFSPYVFAGAGISFLNSRRDYSKLNTTVFDPKSDVAIGLAVDIEKNPPRLLPVIPLGAGLQYSLSPRLALNGEATYRFTASDYLDGFKYAANPGKKDSYYGVSVGLSYSLGKNRYNCPKAW